MKNLLVSVATTAVCVFSTNASALTTGDLLAFNAGTNCGATCDGGSYLFYEISPGFVVHDQLVPGPDGGIFIDVVQTALGNHAGAPDGSETPTISTAKNMILGDMGMLSSSAPVTIATDMGSTKILDLSGLDFLWNGLVLDFAGDPLTYSGESSLATLVCSTAACTGGDSFSLDWAGHFVADDPSGFGGVYWGLHMEGTVVNAVPVPAAVWLFVSGILGLFGAARRKK